MKSLFLVVAVVMIAVCGGSEPEQTLAPEHTATPTIEAQAVRPSATPTALEEDSKPRLTSTSPTPTKAPEMPKPTATVIIAPSATPSLAAPTETPSEAEFLRARALASILVFNEQDYSAYYEYMSPRFKGICSRAGFVEEAERELATFEEFLGDAELTFEITAVEVSGTEGRVFAQLYIGGELWVPPVENEGEPWVMMNGEWWLEGEDWEEGCPAATPTPAPTATATSTSTPEPTASPTPCPDDLVMAGVVWKESDYGFQYLVMELGSTTGRELPYTAVTFGLHAGCHHVIAGSAADSYQLAAW